MRRSAIPNRSVAPPSSASPGAKRGNAEAGIQAACPGRQRGGKEIGLGAPIGGLDSPAPRLARRLIAGGERILFAQRRDIAQNVERRAFQIATLGGQARLLGTQQQRRLAPLPFLLDGSRALGRPAAPCRSASCALYSETAAALRACAT
ncbi:MAG: hypothetical protein HYZ40_01280 [Rhodospirillales bacterium]|nr:hypothetical protein [Rhodospirillales bacterium]